MSEEYELEGLATTFRGITTNGQVVPDLFHIHPTGVFTEPVRNAAEKFLSTPSSAQLARSVFNVDDVQWRKWMNQHFYVRAGISLQEMTETQRRAIFALLHASLSARGVELTRNNSFVLGDQVVMTPFFVGSEPVRATSGKYKATVVLQQEQNDGLEFLCALPDAQQKKAVLNFSKTGNNNLTEAFKDNVILDYAGLRTNELSDATRRRLRELINQLATWTTATRA
jgi:hypothetical protein